MVERPLCIVKCLRKARVSITRTSILLRFVQASSPFTQGFYIPTYFNRRGLSQWGELQMLRHSGMVFAGDLGGALTPHLYLGSIFMNISIAACLSLRHRDDPPSTWGLHAPSLCITLVFCWHCTCLTWRSLTGVPPMCLGASHVCSTELSLNSGSGLHR